MMRRVHWVVLALLVAVVAVFAVNALASPEPEPQQEQVAQDLAPGSQGLT
jgi:hypothetical protein